MELDDLECNLDKELEDELLYSILAEQLNNEKDEPLNIDKKRKKITSRKRKKKIKFELKIRTVLLLLVTLIANTYAWFIYNTTVSTSIQVHVKSWHFELEAGDISSDFIFKVEEIYPGMEEATSTIEATNSGETDAKLNCEITYLKVLDEEYMIEPENEDDIDPSATYYTSEELLDKILNDYPFKIEIYIGGVLYDGETEFIIQAEDPMTTIEYKVNWPYETFDDDDKLMDDVDTYWGEKAYDYYNDEDNPGDHYCIEIRLKITATQTNEPLTPTPDPDPGP